MSSGVDSLRRASAARLAVSQPIVTPKPVAFTDAQVEKGKAVAAQVAGYFHAVRAAEANKPTGFAKFLDDWWVDDFTALPGMGWTGAVATGADTMYDTVNWAVSGAALAATPGYWRNRGENGNLWQDATKVSAGQSFQAFSSGMQDALGQAVTGEAQGVYSINPDFNIADDQQRREWFNLTPASIGSGVGDFVVSWYLDPLVVLGKGAKIARYGSEMFNSAGVTSRAVHMGDMVETVGFEADDAIRFIESGGKVGRETPIGVLGDTVAKSNYSELLEVPGIKQSPYADDLARIGDKIEDPIEGTLFVAAAAGNVRYQRLLAQRAAAVHDAMVRATDANAYERAWLDDYAAVQSPPPLLNDVLELNVKGEALVDDLVRRDKGLQQALGLLDEADTPLATVGGTSVKGMKLAAAWRAGRANRGLRYQARKAGETDSLTWTERVPGVLSADIAEGVRRGHLTPEAGASMEAAAAAASKGFNNAIDRAAGLTTGSSPGVYERVFQLSADFRRVRVWDWISKQRGSGWLAIRGLDEGNATDELVAAATDSATVRKDQAFLQTLIGKWAGASGTQDKWAVATEIEQDIVRRIAREYDVPEEVALKVYKYVDRRRASMIESFMSRKNRAFGVDPESGDLITASPLLLSQLETKIPMMDFRLMESTIKKLSQGHRRHLWDEILADANDIGFNAPRSHTLGIFMDEVNSLWKAAVLMRLGYTQRNVLEGWMRTWAVLGSIPALAPMNAARGLYRLAWGNPRAAAMQRSMSAIEKNLATVVEEQRAAVRALDEELAPLSMAQGRGWGPTDVVYQRTLAARDEAQQALDDMLSVMDNVAAKRAKYRKRYIGDDEAFAGELGELRRLLASNERTQQQFFDTRLMRDVAGLDSRRWVMVRPNDKQYWDELAQSVEQFRNDPLAYMALDGRSVDDMAAWLASPEAAGYRTEMKLGSSKKQADRVATIHSEVNNYLPTAQARALAVADEVPSPAQLRAALGGMDNLQPIHGRAVQSVLGNEMDPYHGFLQFMFKWLGNKPESALVRQPFYAEVYHRNTESMFRAAKRQGYDDLDEVAQKAWDKRIEQTAHRRALKATNETLFTITRYSNPAAAFRFVSPFFAAWENSMRTWLRIIARDPSVAARAGLLWSLPNQLGWVVDKDGNRVESDRYGFLTGSENQYIVLPKEIASGLSELAGGLPVKFPKGAFNVVSPGETPFFPGFGPAVTAPAAMILGGKPDTQAFLRKTLGSKVYNQIAPFGNVPAGGLGEVIQDTVLPAGIRKGVQYVMGENSDEYLAVAGAIAQQEMVDWFAAGGAESGLPKPTAKMIKEKADSFYKFSILASYVSPVAITRMSKYQPQIDFWNGLKANDALAYDRKLALFREKYGDSFMPLTNSTSRSEVRGLDPTMQQFETMTALSDQVEALAAIDPMMVSVIASTVADGEFDLGVYNYWLANKMPGTSGTFKERAQIGDVINEAQSSEMWTEYRQEKANLEAGLAVLGVKTVNTQAAREAGLYDQWQAFQDRMKGKYGEVWTAMGPQYFQTNQPRVMTAIDMLLNDEKFAQSELGQSPTWGRIAQYMDLRRQANEAIADGVDAEFVKQEWENDVQALRFTSLGFADFYDQFLQYDSLTIEVPNG